MHVHARSSSLANLSADECILVVQWDLLPHAHRAAGPLLTVTKSQPSLSMLCLQSEFSSCILKLFTDSCVSRATELYCKHVTVNLIACFQNLSC